MTDDLEAHAEEIAEDTGAAVCEVHDRLRALVIGYKVPVSEAVRSVRQSDELDRGADPSPPTPAPITDELEDGEPAAVRAEGGSAAATAGATVLIGTVELLGRSSPWVAKFDTGEAWRWESDSPQLKTIDLEAHDMGPPKEVRRGHRDEYNVSPGLSPTDDGGVKLLIPEPVWDGRGVEYYTPQPHGVVTAVETGAIVDPGELLPGEDNTLGGDA